MPSAPPPTLRIASDYSRTNGDVACKLVSALGEDADDAERQVLRDWLALDDDGKYSHVRNFLACPRQNLKTWSIKARTLFGALIVGERVLYTAHNGDTAAEFREGLLDLFGRRHGDPKSVPWLNKRVKRWRLTNGHETIFFKNGGSIYFSTRTDTMKLGFTVDVIVFDEAQRLRETHLSALLSTAAAAPLRNPQYIFCGTPPEPNNYSDVFQTKLEEVAHGTADAAEGIASLNRWSANDVDGFEPTKEWVRRPEIWRATNPAFGTRINENTVKAELGTYLDPLTFAQQRLCYFLPRELGAGKMITADEWQALEVEAAPGERDKLAFGIRFSSDGRTVSVASCQTSGERSHVEFITQRQTSDGIAWLIDALASHADDVALVAIDGRSDAADCARRLTEAGMSKKASVVVSSKDVTAAAGMLMHSIHDKTFSHLHDEAFAEAATNAIRRKVGTDGFGFGGEFHERMEAAALALWAARTTKRDPHRRAVIW